MTPAGEQLCYTDAYARRIDARVASVADGDVPLVVLDRTTFYPGGGGQPSDRGVLLRAADGRTWTVRAARKLDGEIAHELEPSPDMRSNSKSIRPDPGSMLPPVTRAP